jgi:hypothetical protein
MTAKPFTFEYDATTGIFMVEALKEKAQQERRIARDHHAHTEGPMSDHYAELMVQAQNRAQLLEDAAREIHKTVHEELVRNFQSAFERMGE